MRVVDLGKSSPYKRVTVLSYGALRTGKTRWAATFPRPLFLSDNTETGWTTIAHMHPESFFEPGHLPMVWAIEKATDMPEAISKLEDLLRNEPGRVLTVVVDSLTFYADLFFNMIDSAARTNNRIPDNRMLYATLAAHLRDLRIRIHNLNINVVWLCLEKAPTADEPTGGPMLSGQSAQKFAAGCDYVLFHRSFQLPNQPLQWDIRTRKYNQYPAGGRDEGLLPDPLGFMEEVQGDDGTLQQVWTIDCTYRTLALCLGITDKEALQIPPPPSTPVMAPVKPIPPKPVEPPKTVEPPKVVEPARRPGKPTGGPVTRS